VSDCQVPLDLINVVAVVLVVLVAVVVAVVAVADVDVALMPAGAADAVGVAVVTLETVIVT
jgi:hypothetical protein